MKDKALEKALGTLVTLKSITNFWKKYEKKNKIGKSRERKNVIHRQAFMQVARETAKLPCIKVAGILEKNHATVIHACKLHETNYRFDADYREIHSFMYKKINELLLSNGYIPESAKNNEKLLEMHYKLSKVSKRLREVIIEFEDYKKSVKKEMEKSKVIINYSDSLKKRNEKLNRELIRLKKLL
tara:strand:+ start:173 stop:727 length:555 start_codon:yes stop_codon:yes gene_type:complete